MHLVNFYCIALYICICFIRGLCLKKYSTRGAHAKMCDSSIKEMLRKNANLQGGLDSGA